MLAKSQHCDKTPEEMSLFGRMFYCDLVVLVHGSVILIIWASGMAAHYGENTREKKLFTSWQP